MARPRKKKPEEPQAPVVSSVIPSETAEHVFSELETDGNLPVMTGVGYARVAPGSRDYVSYVVRFRGREVLSIECGTPNMKAIACDEAKINFVTILDDADQMLEEDLKHIAEDRAARPA